MRFVRTFRGIVAGVLLALIITATARAKYGGGTGEPDDSDQIATAADPIALGEMTNGSPDIWWLEEGKDYPRLWWELRKETQPNS